MAGNIGIEYSCALTCVYPLRFYPLHFYLPRIYSLRFYQLHFYSPRFHPPRLTYCYVNARGVNVKAHENQTVQSGYNARYTFSAKEKDDETQYSYFGARYYDSDLSVWLSVDPLSDKYPNLSPYAYCANNPVKLVDSDGREIYLVDQNGNKTKLTPENYKSNIFGSNLTILMSTTEGKKLLEKYMSNGSKDIYMTVGDAGGDAAGRTLSGFSYDNSTKDGKFLYSAEDLSVYGKGFEAFGNLDMSESKGKDIFLISITPSQISSGPDKSGTFFEFDIQGAETVFHEIKAHVDLNTGNGKKEHELYGATFSIFNYNKIDPNTPAAEFVRSVLD